MKIPWFKIFFSLLCLFIIINNFIFYPVNILSQDTWGYYLYLPLSFIYHDLGLYHDSILQTIIEKYKNTDSLYQLIKMPEGNYVIKYSMGMAFFYAPFFFIGHLIAKIGNYPVDGFSPPYQYAVFIGSIIWSLVGLLFLSKVLKRFFTEKIVVCVLILLVFSTNYLNLNTMYGGNASPHSYLFTTYALIIWLSILWHDTFKLKYAILLGMVCGITILSRPSEIVCLIIPAFWGITDRISFIEKKKLFTQNKKQVYILFGILLLFGLVQFTYWKIYTGHFLFDSYGANAGEGFEFLSPYILKVLFSYRKGWLLYTPIMSFALIGLGMVYYKNRSIFYALFIYFILNFYIVSSWSCWWYAASFSQRALIPSYPVLAIAFGYFLTWLSNQKILLKSGIIALISGCLFLNLFQIVQYHYEILNPFRMTKEYYWKIFGKMTVTDEDRKLLLINRAGNGVEIFNNGNEYNSRLLEKLDFENSEQRDSSVSHTGKFAFKLDSSVIYSPGITAPYEQITNKDHAWIRATVFIYPIKDIINDPFSLVVQFTYHNKPYKWMSYNSENTHLEQNKWNKIVFDYLTPEVRKESDPLNVFIWNRGKTAFFIDDLQVEVFDKK